LSSASAAAARRQHTLRGRPCKTSLVSRGPSHQHTPLRPSCPRRCHVHSPPHKGETGTKRCRATAEQSSSSGPRRPQHVKLNSERAAPSQPPPVVWRASSACMAPGAAREGRRGEQCGTGGGLTIYRHLPCRAVQQLERAAVRQRTLLLIGNDSSLPSALVRRGCSRRRRSHQASRRPATCGTSLIRSVGSFQRAPPRGRRGSSCSACGGNCSQVGARSARVCTERLQPAEGRLRHREMGWPRRWTRPRARLLVGDPWAGVEPSRAAASDPPSNAALARACRSSAASGLLRKPHLATIYRYCRDSFSYRE